MYTILINEATSESDSQWPKESMRQKGIPDRVANLVVEAPVWKKHVGQVGSFPEIGVNIKKIQTKNNHL